MGYFAESGNEAVTDINITETLFFDVEFDNGNVMGTKTIDLTKKNKQKVLLTGNATLTFTNPGGPSSIILRVVQDATGNRVITWPSSVKWVQGVIPTLSTGGNSIDIVAFYFDGTDYYGNISHNFS